MNGKKGMTVRRAAELAGVSPATVSRAVNGLPGMKEETRKRVLRVFAGSMPPRRGRTRGNCIALLMPQRQLYCRDFFDQLRKILQHFGRKWELLLLPADISGAEFERKALQERIAGVILCGFRLADPELAGAVEKIPHVWLNSHASGGEETSVLMGNEQSGRLAARYLLERGCRNCAVIGLRGENPGLRARCEGFRFECFSAEAPCTVLNFETACVEQLGHRELERIFTAAAAEGRFASFDGIFLPECFLLPSLSLVLHRFREEPEFPLLVCGNSSEDLLAGIRPEAAVIDTGAEMLAELACRELFRRIEGVPADSRAALFLTPRLRRPGSD